MRFVTIKSGFQTPMATFAPSVGLNVAIHVWNLIQSVPILIETCRFIQGRYTTHTIMHWLFDEIL